VSAALSVGSLLSGNYHTTEKRALTDPDVLDWARDDRVRKTREEACRGKLRAREHRAVGPADARRAVALAEEALRVLHRGELDRDAEADAEERGERALVERERALVLQERARAVAHTRERARRRGLHALQARQ
jgi:hypothetical protein